MPNADTVVVLDFETTGLSPGASDHKLGTLVEFMSIPVEGVFHRALYDSEMTAKLWLAMLDDVRQRYLLSAIDFGLMQRLARTPKHAVDGFWKAACHIPV